ncbi:hypothetical protein GBAR_LOCUS7656 [Geodia barretti]|uniref:Uncharacterized protein n=1 Tax=Geodia barretti TaxID=519541 RepID=A0AA35W8D3_GEOBA|nr:hypothetical protein GBAR_LOCUS7656 [Geodia barretti]
MEQYYRLVCERREQAVRRNQALQRHARQACTSLAVPVDTSKLETLKSQYKLSVERLSPNWLNSHVSQTSQNHGLPSPGLGQQKSLTLHLPQTGNVTNTHYSMSTVSPSFPYQTCLSPHSSTRLPPTANTDPITHPTAVHTGPLTFPKPPAPVSTSTTLTQHQFQTTSAARPSTPPTAGYRSLPKSPVLVSESLSSLPHLAPCPTLAPLCSSQSPAIPHYTDSTALLSQLTETNPSSCAPEQTPRQKPLQPLCPHNIHLQPMQLEKTTYQVSQAISQWMWLLDHTMSWFSLRKTLTLLSLFLHLLFPRTLRSFSLLTMILTVL